MKYLLSVALILIAGLAGAQDEIIPLNEELEIVVLSPTLLVHRSYTTLEPYGRFYSNGLIYVQGKECIVFDTPMEPAVTEVLLNWIEQEKGLAIKGIVVNHFHEDCLGGLTLFHERGIPSYASQRTIILAAGAGLPAPQQGFRKRQKLSLGTKTVLNYYPGPAHSPDNIVSWLPDEQVLFGGCMVKSLQASKGNLADADVASWPRTIATVQRKFPDATRVIPGHGPYGDRALLEYTIELFQP